MRVWMMSWIRCIREIFSGEIRDFRPSGAGGLSAVFLRLGLKKFKQILGLWLILSKRKRIVSGYPQNI